MKIPLNPEGSSKSNGANKFNFYETHRVDNQSSTKGRNHPDVVAMNMSKTQTVGQRPSSKVSTADKKSILLH